LYIIQNAVRYVYIISIGTEHIYNAVLTKAGEFGIFSELGISFEPLGN